MAPTLPPGSLLAVSPVRRGPAYGAVVVIRRSDGTEHVKRVVGTPGMFVRFPGGEFLELGAEEYAVAGDNRASSTDSRHYGAVRRSEIVSLVRACYWPPSALRLVPVG